MREVFCLFIFINYWNCNESDSLRKHDNPPTLTVESSSCLGSIGRAGTVNTLRSFERGGVQLQKLHRWNYRNNAFYKTRSEGRNCRKVTFSWQRREGRKRAKEILGQGKISLILVDFLLDGLRQYYY